MKEVRDFKGVWIAKEVWLDERLNALDKIILTEIDSLDNEETGCFASNKHIADFCQCSETKVSMAISKLIKCGYLEVQSFDGRTRKLKSCLSKNESLPFKICKADLQKMKESNTNSNKDSIIYIIDYLNLRTGKNFKNTSSKAVRSITARLNEGFTVDDFKKVIDNKTTQWKGTSMEEYLRPETLFGTKFDGYLNCSVGNLSKQGNYSVEGENYKIL